MAFRNPNKNMSMVEAIQFAPIFKLGTLNDLYHYEEECKWVLNRVSRSDRLIVIKAIIQKLSGEGFEDIGNINISSWREFRAHLRRCFEIYAETIIGRCIYCKPGTHDINECPRRFTQEMRQRHQVIMELTAVVPLRIYCSSRRFYPTSVIMLVDSSYDICVIKLSTLTGTFSINQMERRMYVLLDGVIEYSYGSSEIRVKINGKTSKIKFDIVGEHFPIPVSGIIGSNYIRV